MSYTLALTLLSVLAGVVASITGFGIGSILTPAFAWGIGSRLGMDTKLAVAAVAIPHFAATLTRFIMMRRYIDRKVLLSFGSMSAIGGLIGALLHSSLNSDYLTLIFGGLLVLSGLMGITGVAQRMKLHGPIAYLDGAVSGLFGGLVGNQGGIRTAGLLAFEMSKEAFVATATAVGVIVDLARMPVYLATEYTSLRSISVLVGCATLGALAGTFLGAGYLKHIPEAQFKKVVSVIVLVLGVYMICQGI